MISRLKKTIFALILVSVALGTTSCSLISKQRFTDYSFDYFDTVTEIIGYESSKAAFLENAEKIKNMLNEYHVLYDAYKDYGGVNNIKTINDKAGDGEWVPVDGKIIDLLLFSLDMYELTKGEVNVAFGPVTALWKAADASSGTDTPYLPSDIELMNASLLTSISNILIDEDTSSVRLANKGARIDVGAIGKGYATERVARELIDTGLTSYVLNVGGNVRCLSGKTESEPFYIGVEIPDGVSLSDLSVPMSKGALVTSGSVKRDFEINGVKYHHIIDKDTLCPGDNFISVSVLCPDSGMADALSTALFLLDYEVGLVLVDSLGEVEAMWIDKEGNTHYSKGFLNGLL